MQSESSPKGKKPRKIKPVGADGHRARMFERFLNAGEADIPVRDIIEMLLYFSIRVRDTRDSAVELMEHFDGDLDRLFEAPAEELIKTEGVGASSALLLEAVGCMADRIAAEDDSSEDICGKYIGWDNLAKIIMSKHRRLRHDVTWAVFFDSSMRVICMEQVKDAPLDEDGDDVFSLINLAVRHHAGAVAVVRYSCEYICYPTTADYKLAQRLEALFNAANITLVEYYVATSDDCFAVKKIYSE